jgi:signal transduction histidine kinase
MRKSTIIVMLVIQILLLFIFTNVQSLFKPLEKNEFESLKRLSDLLAENLVIKHQQNLKKLRESGYFEHIKILSGSKSSKKVKMINEQLYYSIKLPISASNVIQFEKRLDSKLLVTLEKLNSLFFSLSLVFGIFIIFTGFYFVFQLKKTKTIRAPQAIGPLQDYLLKLKGSELELKSLVQTQQKKVTQKEELNKSIINNINSAIIFVNKANRIEIFNLVAQNYFSQSYAHIMNNDLNSALANFPEILNFIHSNPNVSISSEIKAKNKIFDMYVNPLEDIGKIIIIKDVTEERKREEIDTRNKNFIMLGEMAAFLAHEIRNSLGVILGYTKTIKSEPTKVNEVNNEISFLTTMMENFLNFSKPIKKKSLVEFDLSSMLKKIAAEKSMDLKIINESVNSIIENDVSLFHSIFSNLFLNSKEAGAEKITIRLKNKQKLEIEFQDNGHGIPDKIKEKIWFPFFTTKEKGTGMGLAFIRKIINSLNGEISLLDSSKKGTTLKIILYN